VSLRYLARQVARLLENREQLTEVEREEIGSAAGTLRAWLQQWDQWKQKQARVA